MNRNGTAPGVRGRFATVLVRLLTALLAAGALVALPAVTDTAPMAYAQTNCKTRVITPPVRVGGGVRAEGVVECNGRVPEIDASGVLFRAGTHVDTDTCGSPAARSCHVTPFGTTNVQGPGEWCFVVQGGFTPFDKTYEYVDEAKACALL